MEIKKEISFKNESSIQARLFFLPCYLIQILAEKIHMLKWRKGPVSYINLQTLDKSHTWCSLRKTPFNFIPKMKNIYRQVNVQKPYLNYMHPVTRRRPHVLRLRPSEGHDERSHVLRLRPSEGHDERPRDAEKIPRATAETQ